MLEEALSMSTAVQLTFPSTRAERLAWNFRYAAREVLAGNGPVTMEVPGFSSYNAAGAREGLWRFALELSLEEKRRWEIEVPRDPKFPEPDDGAVFKKRSDKKLDDKWYLHFRPELARLLREMRGIRLTPWQEEWFGHLNQLWHAAERAHLEYATAVDQLQPEVQFVERIGRIGTDQHVLRLLRYEPHSGTIAEWHADRNATTFHMAESAPGLRVKKGWDVIPQASPEPPEVLVFSGDQLAKVTQNSVPAVHHVVVDSTGGLEERFAMVFFGKMSTERL